MINGTVAAATTFQADIFASVVNVMVAARSELLLFVAAVVAYFALFMQRAPRNAKRQSKKIKAYEEDYKEEDYPVDTDKKCSIVDTKECCKVEKSLQDAFENGDYRAVLRCWNTMKKI